MRSKTLCAVPIGFTAFTLLITGCGASRATGGTSGASCVAPYLNDQPPSGPFHGPTPTVAAGGTVTIYGHWYTTTCNDTGGHDSLQAMPPVHLTLTLPGGATTEMGQFTGHGQDMGFSTTVQVPGPTPAGTATIHDDQPHPATFTFKVSHEPRRANTRPHRRSASPRAGHPAGSTWQCAPIVSMSRSALARRGNEFCLEGD
jgi:hypothetical protein